MATAPQLIASVVGTDNYSPVYNPDSRWQIWNMNEIYLGTVGWGKYVPKVHDEVHEIIGATITCYIVVEINLVTLVPVFRQEDSSTVTQPLSEDDILFGTGPGTQSDTYRVYIDKSVAPYRLAVDARLSVGGSLVNACKIFRGANVSTSGVVISGIYNANGQLVSENIPLELVASETLTVHAIKAVMPCHTTANLDNGDLVTAVFYDALGFVVSKRQLLVENTSFIRTTDANRRYVVGIDLECPFLTSTNSRLIRYPVNVPLNALNLIGVVNYSDGSARKLAVDGTKFSVAGLSSYAATSVGQRSPIVLKYALSVDEVAYGVSVGSDSHISEFYEIETANTDGAYAVQLYAYPVWVSAVEGYRLEWFLYDLDRGIRYPVTALVTVDPTIKTFNPRQYGVKQILRAKINLKAVNGTYRLFYHVQYLDILLNMPGTDRPGVEKIPNWNVAVTSGLTPPYGESAYATYYRRATNAWDVKISGGLLTQAAWLTAVYRTTSPLFDNQRESAAPAPTHFILESGANSAEYPISAWDDMITLNGTLQNNSTLLLKFFKRTTDTDLHLSVAGMPLYAVDDVGNYL